MGQQLLEKRGRGMLLASRGACGEELLQG